MSNTTFNVPGSAEPAPTSDSGSSPSALEIAIGVLALVLGLAAVAVGIAQFCQGRAKRLAQKQAASGQPGIELPDYPGQIADTDSVKTSCTYK